MMKQPAGTRQKPPLQSLSTDGCTQPALGWRSSSEGTVAAGSGGAESRDDAGVGASPPV